MNAENLIVISSNRFTAGSSSSSKHSFSSRSRSASHVVRSRHPNDPAHQHNLNSSQRSTLRAIADSGFLPADLPARSAVKSLSSSRNLPEGTRPGLFPEDLHRMGFDLPRGLDELDTIARLRAGYRFADLPPELREAVLGLVATRDLTSPSLDLALWLEDLLCPPTPV